MVQSEHPVTTPSVPPPPPRDRLGTTAFVLGLASALTGVVYFVAVPVGLAGLVVSMIALHRGSVRRVALGGLLLSIVGLVVGLGVVAFLILDDDATGGTPTVLDGVESGSRNTEHPPQRDLDPGLTCTVDAHVLQASGQVTNHTDGVANYQLIATWERNGKGIAESTALLDGVLPGASRSWEVTAVGDDEPGAITCRVLRIDRSD